MPAKESLTGEAAGLPPAERVTVFGSPRPEGQPPDDATREARIPEARIPEARTPEFSAPRHWTRDHQERDHQERDHRERDHQRRESAYPDALEPDVVKEFALERYRYILQQIDTLNKNVFKFLSIYQALSTTLAAALIGLLTGYRKAGIEPAIARQGALGLMWLITLVAGFAILLILIGVAGWVDYRNEECELTDQIVRAEFRKKPRMGNFVRWYETYVVLFIVASVVFMWSYGLMMIIPATT